MAYCTPAEVRAVGTRLTATNETNPLTDDLLTDIIEWASRIFDLECGVDPEHFEAAGVTATSRTFYGDGSNYLKLDPYVEGSLNTTITLPDGYTAPSFVQRDGYLVLTTSNGILPPFYPYGPSTTWTGWYQGVAVTVSARWGYEATPADVKFAVIKLVIHIWRTIDPTQLKLLVLEGQPLFRERMPEDVAAIAHKYRVGGVALV